MYLSRHKLFEHLWAPKNFRGKIFLARFYSWALMIRAIINVHFDEVTPLLPSLEVYNAIKYARENNKDIFSFFRQKNHPKVLNFRFYGLSLFILVKRRAKKR